MSCEQFHGPLIITINAGKLVSSLIVTHVFLTIVKTVLQKQNFFFISTRTELTFLLSPSLSHPQNPALNVPNKYPILFWFLSLVALWMSPHMITHAYS